MPHRIGNKYRITSKLFKTDLKAFDINEIHDFMNKFKSHIPEYSVAYLGLSNSQTQYSNQQVA